MSQSVDVAGQLQEALGTRYEVEGELGRGGMAVVFLAHDRRHGRRVALKVLRPELASYLGPDRFLREIRFVASLSHPHILPLFDSGEAGQLLYYVMPWAEDGTLRDRMDREGRIGIRETIEIGRAVAMALDFAHRKGIVHRDIKPANIMLIDGVPMVADFGIGKAVSDVGKGDETTAAGLAVGTPSYMSPEQAAGDKAVDGRSDIYNLGCVLFEMITGVLPFEAHSVQAVIAKRFFTEAPRLTTLVHAVPAALEEAVHKALSLDPSDRHATGTHLAAALEATRSHSTPAPASPNVRSIAVLPFENMSEDVENAYLSDGISEEVTHALGRVSGLRVVARTSAFSFKGRNEDIRTIARKLNVSSVLTGSVRRAGNRIRISAQLVDAATGFERWSSRYDRELTDIFAVQDEITAEIVNTLKVTLLGAPRVASRKADPEAYEHYLRGRYLVNERTQHSLREAIGLLRGAAQRDAEFALGQVALAEAYLLQAVYGVEPPLKAMPLAREAAERALQLDGTLAEAFAALGCVAALFEWEWDAAEASMQRAAALAPSYSTTHHWYAANVLAPLGRFEEALASLDRARELDPVSPAIPVTVGFVNLAQRHYDRAIATLEDVAGMYPDFSLGGYFLGQAYVAADRSAEAIEVLQRAATSSDNSPEIVATLAYALGRDGQEEAARQLLTRLTEWSRERYVEPTYLAWAHLGLGEVDRAHDALALAHETRATGLAWLAVRPLYDALRDDPRFGRLVAAVGLTRIDTSGGS